MRGWGGGGSEPLLLLPLLAGESAGESVDGLRCGGWLTLVKGSTLVPSSPAGFLVFKVELVPPGGFQQTFFRDEVFGGSRH